MLLAIRPGRCFKLLLVLVANSKNRHFVVDAVDDIAYGAGVGISDC